MALVIGKNSFASVEEADIYFELRLDSSAWTSATDDQKEQALVSASLALNELSYRGFSSAGNMAWPRTGSFLDKATGKQVQFSSTYDFTTFDTNLYDEDLAQQWLDLPREIQLIKTATYEQAYHLLNNENTFDTSVSPDEIKIGSISLKGLSRGGSPKRSSKAFSMLKPLLSDSGTNMWHRVN